MGSLAPNMMFEGTIEESKYGEVNGVQYQLAQNDMVGDSCLHGGEAGWDKKVWEAEQDRDKGTVTMAYHSSDGEEGYPGDVIVIVTYAVVGSSINISYQAMSSKSTIINITNHSYFNLGNMKDIKDHTVTIHSDKYVEVDKKLIPTGNLVLVTDTIMDLRKPKVLGEILPKCPGGEFAGFSHCLVVEENLKKNATPTCKDNLVDIARVEDKASGRGMKVSTDQPGVIFYTGQYNS